MGIDPGIRGALCVLEVYGPYQRPKLITVLDFPLKEVSKSKAKGTTATRIDLKALAFLIDAWSSGVKIALIEDVGTVGTNADPFSSFVFGFATGAVHGILSATDIQIEVIKPAVWKAGYGLTADKNKSIALAKKLIPECERYLTLKKHDGRSEAILLANFAAVNIRKK